MLQRMITTVPSDLADSFELRRMPGRVALVRSDFGPAFEALGLLASPGAPTAATEPARATAGGRGGARIVDAGAGDEIVVRPGRRGGWFGKLVRSRYFAGDRFTDELILTERLRRRGAPVPEPLAAVRQQRRVGYETWLATRRIPGAEPAAVTLAATPAERLAGPLRAMGRAVRALHDAGGDHADLNAWNVLITPAGAGSGEARAHVVDLDRGHLRPAPLGARRVESNFARLRRSLRKLELDHVLAAWPEFERGYASGASAPGDPAAGDTAAADGAAS
ncbi:MAG TPA: lipopolysaccharide kinase InaA family protein [Gemmatimonadota bacterium]|nr:lipopolysaccharide kinase InaA family protein [Gemmatimonadota bacterium]